MPRINRLTQTQIDEMERDLAHDKVCTEDEPCSQHGGVEEEESAVGRFTYDLGLALVKMRAR